MKTLQQTSGIKKLLLLIFTVLIFSSCAESVTLTESLPYEPVGFWYGLLHGFILPFSFIVSLFDPDVAIYAIYNNGAWYNFGFIMGATMVFGGGGKASKK
ncbi:MAG: hypothetical protein WEA56_00100 [Balneolaceae bacterium]